MAPDTLTADEVFELAMAETRANIVKALAVRHEISGKGGDYERGRLQAQGVMRTLDFKAAVEDLRALCGSTLWSRDYIAGYQAAVLAAAGQP